MGVEQKIEEGKQRFWKRGQAQLKLNCGSLKNGKLEPPYELYMETNNWAIDKYEFVNKLMFFFCVIKKCFSQCVSRSTTNSLTRHW